MHTCDACGQPTDDPRTVVFKRDNVTFVVCGEHCVTQLNRDVWDLNPGSGTSD